MSVKKIVINGLIFLVGAAVGGGCTFLYCKKGEEDRIQAEVDAVRRDLKRAYSDGSESVEEKNDQDIEKALETPRNGLKTHISGIPEAERRERLEKASELVIQQDYGGYFDYEKFDESTVKVDGRGQPIDKPEKTFKDPREVLIEDIIESTAPSDDDNPIVLTEEMLDNYDTRDMQFCTLYLGDQLLVDDQTREVLSVPDTIGEDIFMKFLMAHQQDEIFVKDPKTDTLFDITKANEAWMEVEEDYHGGV